MTPAKVDTPWIPPATPLPTKDSAQENLNMDERLKNRRGMAATELSASGGLKQSNEAQKAGMAATKKLLGQAV